MILMKRILFFFISISHLTFHQFNFILCVKNVNQLYSPYELTINGQAVSYSPSATSHRAVDSNSYDINLIEGRTQPVPQTRYPFDSPQFNSISPSLSPGPPESHFQSYQPPFSPKPLHPFAIDSHLPNYPDYGSTKRYGLSHPLDGMDMPFHNSIGPSDHGPSYPCNCVPVHMCKGHWSGSVGHFYGDGPALHPFIPAHHHPPNPMANDGYYYQKREGDSPPTTQSTEDQQKEQGTTPNSTKSYDRKYDKYGPSSECGYKRVCCQLWSYSPNYGPPPSFPPMPGYHHHHHHQSPPNYFHGHGHGYNPYYSYTHSSSPSYFGPPHPRTYYPSKSYGPNYFGPESYGPRYNFGQHRPYSSAYSASPQEIYSPNSRVNYLPRYSSSSPYPPNSLYDQASQKMVQHSDRVNDSMTVPSFTREVTTSLPANNNSSGSSKLASPSFNYFDS